MNIFEVEYEKNLKFFYGLFDVLNKELFSNELEAVAITLQQDIKDECYGWFTRGKVWEVQNSASEEVTPSAEADGKDAVQAEQKAEQKKETEKVTFHEINLTAQYLNRPLIEVARTLLHEMIHHYNQQNDIIDTSRNGKYHNTRFKKNAELHGLDVAFIDKKHGWTNCTLQERAKIIIEKYIEEHPVTLLYRSYFKVKKPRKKVTRYTYFCPDCEQKLISTNAELKLMCSECEVEFERK